MEALKRLAALLLLCLLLCGCVTYRDPVLASLPSDGQGSVYTHGKFQDYTDYGKYRYSGITKETLEENEYFQRVEASHIPALTAYLEDFEKWVALAQDCSDCELAEMYDFSPEMLREGDYFCLVDNSGSGIYSNYDIYYFSTETQTLYYFHNNI